MKKHCNIPIFIPELACPFQCIFCNQKKISGNIKIPNTNEVISIIDTYLSGLDEKCETEVAFFGGNFTGIDIALQKEYLLTVKPYIDKGVISGIRVSTRPDYINNEILTLLSEYGVKTIELGAQSLDKDVLIQSGRGHSYEDVKNASIAIKEAGFSLGLQMMIGLPGDTLEKSLETAKKIVELKADNTRIYPTVVVKDTRLEKFYNSGKFIPLSLETAVEWSKELFKFFEKTPVKVLRVGLHPSEGLLSGESLVAGPFHTSFKELVLTEIWNELLSDLNIYHYHNINLTVPPSEINYAIGHKSKNKDMLLKRYQKVLIRTDPKLKNRNFYVDYY